MSKYPHQWVSLPERRIESRKRLFGSSSPELDVVKCGECVMPRKIVPLAEKIYAFKARPDDIWVVTYPKTGTTWTQELLWQLMHGVELEAVKTTPLEKRSVYLEFSALYPSSLNRPPHVEDALGYAERMNSPRVIKTHLPFEQLPPDLLGTCKVVYVCRNAKDACVSYYYHYKLWEDFYDFRGNFEDFAELFMRGETQYGDFFAHLKVREGEICCCVAHYYFKGAWKRRNEPNLKIVWYEDLKADLTGAIHDLASFVGSSNNDEEVVEKLSHFLDIDNYRKAVIESVENDGNAKKAVEKFFRAGKVGDWANLLNSNLEARFDSWIECNLSGCDMPMKFNLN